MITTTYLESDFTAELWIELKEELTKMVAAGTGCMFMAYNDRIRATIPHEANDWIQTLKIQQ